MMITAQWRSTHVASATASHHGERMQGKGFNPNPMSFINLIRDNLRDRYKKGFPVFKELIQNADDAEASTLEIGLVPGFPDALHPLLRGPAILVANDGPFRAANAAAIREFGLSNRGGEKATIGKFGLGLKSVFHLCEAFFYVSCAEPMPEEQEFSRRDILNPWSGATVDGSFLHGDWDSFDEADQDRVIALLNRLEERNWFAVWIPLRRSDHCNKERGLYPIVEEFPGDSQTTLPNLLGPMFDRKIARLIPMLRNLKTLRLWSGNDNGERLPVCEFVLTPDSTRRRLESHLSPLEPGKRSPIRGLVKVSPYETRETTYQFSGLESLLADPLFQELKDVPAWPLQVVNVMAGQSTHVREKAEPHSAVYFARTPALERGNLIASWATFLPVGDEQIVDCPGQWDYELTLHGYFFVDAGRQRIEDERNIADATLDERGVRCRWNAELSQKGTLPLLLPALDSFCRENQVKTKQATSLTYALGRLPVVRENLEHICRDVQWVFRLDPSGGAWTLVAATEPILELPLPAEDAMTRPLEVFPPLNELSNRHCFTFSDQSHPRISTRAESDFWPEDLVCQLLDLNAANTFSRTTHLRYLAEFLENTKVHTASEKVAKGLVDLIRAALIQINLADLRRNASLFSRIVATIPGHLRFTIDCRNPKAISPNDLSSDRVMKTILELGTELLLVPSYLAPDSEQISGQCLGKRDAQTILRKLADVDNEQDEPTAAVTIRSLIARQIIRQFQANKEAVREVCGNLPLFKGLDCKAPKERSFSLPELTSIRDAATLFCYSSIANPKGLAPHLQNALEDAKVVLIPSDVARDLFGEQLVRQCDAEGAIIALSQCPRLTSPERRSELLRRLLAEDEASKKCSKFRQCLRYLLHGSANNFSSQETLWIRQLPTDLHVWIKVAKDVLDFRRESWRLLPEQTTGKLAWDHYAALGVEVIAPAQLTQLIREVGPENVDLSDLTSSEFDDLMLQITDTDVLKKLRIHARVGDGIRVAIEPDTYLEGDFPLPAAKWPITLIRFNPEAKIAEVQKRLARPLDAASAIEIVLSGLDSSDAETFKPSMFWHTIMDALDRLPVEEIESPRLMPRLRATEWIPLTNGGSASPESIIHVAGMEPQIAQVVMQASCRYSAVLSIENGAQDHVAFTKVLNHLVLSVEDSLSALGKVLAEQIDFRIGCVPLEKFQLETWANAFTGAPIGLLPACEIITQAASVTSQAHCRTHLVPQLAKRQDSEKQIEVLRYLQAKHSKPGNNKAALAETFLLYLDAAARESCFFDSILPEIKLLNRSGNTWKSPNDLCNASTGIDPSDILHHEHAKIFRDYHIDAKSATTSVAKSTVKANDHDDSEEPSDKIRKSAAILKDYFAKWDPYTHNREVIGAFLALLGDFPEILELSKFYLGKNRFVDSTRDLFGWQAISASAEPWAKESINEAMKRQRFVVEIVRGETVEVLNLLGKPFQATLERKIQTILVDTMQPRLQPKLTFGLHGSDHRIGVLRLRDIRPEDPGFKPEEVLMESARSLFNRTYCRDVPNIEEVWKELSQSEQLDIDIVQDLLLENALVMLRTLGVKNSDSLSDLLIEWDEVRHRKAEATRATARVFKNADGGHLKLEAKIQDIKDRLKKVIQQDEAAQSTILDAVRGKVSKYQYTPESIAFELFQNADDAVVEWEMIKGSASGSAKFTIVQKGSEFTFMHWGRPINQDWSASHDLKRRGFSRDLEKMLILNYSDKETSIREDYTTGKFGLGFKSIFLVCRRPKVQSARLAFEVVGGMLPVKSKSTDLRTLLQAHDPDLAHGTAIQIQVDAASEAPPAGGLLRRFAALVPVLLVFARRINRCEIHEEGRPPQTLEWHSSPVAGNDLLRVGVLPGALYGVSASVRGLLLGNGTGSAFVLCGPNGLERLPESVPTLWVTAPTQEAANLGFVINGPFDLDVGRTRVAGATETNREIMRALGNDLGKALADLLNATRTDWQKVQNALGLRADLSIHDFWLSVWQILAMPFETPPSGARHEAFDLVRHALWGGPDAGFYQICQGGSSLPSALPPGQYRDVVDPRDVRRYVTGVLERGDVFNDVSKWRNFERYWPPGAVISGKWTQLFTTVAPELWKARALTLTTVLTDLIGPQMEVDEDSAGQFGQVVTSKLLQLMRDGTEIEREEHGVLTAYLRRLRFKASTGRYKCVDDLVSQSGDPVANREEVMRAEFAPLDCVLQKDYNDMGVAFFRLCRQNMLASTGVLATWALEADDRPRRLAVLRYLVDGHDLVNQLSASLRASLAGSWLEFLNPESDLSSEFQPAEWRQILSMLHLGQDHTPPIPSGKFQVSSPGDSEPISSAEILEKIYKWWASEGTHQLKAYEAQFYPESRAPKLSKSPRSQQERNNWTLVFALGALHTMGRTQPGQHRQFLEMCMNMGWLETFASPTIDHQAWLGIVEGYLGRADLNFEYYHWLRQQFVPLYQISRWLSNYAESFIQADKYGDQFKMGYVTNLRQNAEQQGGGLDAPSVAQALGIGACFVMRELARQGFVKSSHAIRHCYVPRGRLRRLLIKIGCQDLKSDNQTHVQHSETIYDFLVKHMDAEKAKFNNAFDIPLQVIAYDDKLLKKFGLYPIDELGMGRDPTRGYAPFPMAAESRLGR